jgi:23S rRNA pseudouridine1911/1915/1917 synthase
LVKHFPYDEIIVEQPIARFEDTNKRCIDQNGEFAKTKFKKLTSLFMYDLIEATLYTGRTHQIRVHLQYLNTPIIGDELYGNEEGDFYLKSYYLKFNHPVTNEKLEFKLDY